MINILVGLIFEAPNPKIRCLLRLLERCRDAGKRAPSGSVQAYGRIHAAAGEPPTLLEQATASLGVDVLRKTEVVIRANVVSWHVNHKRKQRRRCSRPEAR